MQPIRASHCKDNCLQTLMSSAKQCSKVCAGCAGNILLDGSGTVKVADFGLSRLQAATCGEPLTAELGTWQWMAPEVVAPWDKRGAVYTEKADVYSFGIVMWECAAREVSNLISVML